MSLTNIVKTLTNEEYTLRKNVNAGTSDKVTTRCFSLKGKEFVFDELTYVPSLFKVIDELVVNSVDHFINCIIKNTIQHNMKSGEVNKYVNLIAFKVAEDGRMTILNDGYGIPALRLEHKGNRYLPQVLFSDERTGTNMDDDPNRITGGTNGIGATIVTAFSQDMTIKCVDKDNIYIQQMEKVDGVSVFAEPTITANPDPKKQLTQISFMINWKGTKLGNFKSNKNLFVNYVMKRLKQIALYTEHVTMVAKELKQYSLPAELKPPIIMFPGDKGKNIRVDFSLYNSDHMNEAFKLNRSYRLVIRRKKASSMPLSDVVHLIVGINDLNANYKEMSVINGVEVINNPMIECVKEILIKAVKEFCAHKKMNTGNFKLKNSFTFLMVCCIPNPQWVGQAKESVMVSREYINQFNFKEECESIKGEVSKVIYEMIINNALNRKKPRGEGSVLTDNKSFIKCESTFLPKHKRNWTNYYFFCEGGSAKTLIRGITDFKKKFTSENTCIHMSKGVIPNFYHKMNWYSNENFEYFKLGFGEAVKHKLVLNESLANNDFIKTFIAGSGVGDEKKTDEELLNSINCDEFICATDSDYDGWNITGLLLVMLNKWPALIDKKRVKILHLPIIRIIPRDLEDVHRRAIKANGDNADLGVAFIESIKYWEFFTQRDFENFILTNEIPSTHQVKYYKGLATTNDFFDLVIAYYPERYIFTIVRDPKANDNLEIYYAKRRVEEIDGEIIITKMSDERKRLLAEPIRDMTDGERRLYDMKYITISMFLEIYVKQYFLDNLSRKLLKIADGKNNVSTKIIYSLPSVFGSDNKYTKVALIGPEICNKTHYHHGDTSLTSSIQNSGQQYIGKVMYPVLDTTGKWGNRSDGGEMGNTGSLGAPRYIDCKLNRKFYRALYRSEDGIILPYQEEEGLTIEPKFMLPIFPTIAIENYTTTAHGWKISLWARSFDKVFDYLRLLIGEHFIGDEVMKANIRNRIDRFVLDMEKRNYDIEPKRETYIVNDRQGRECQKEIFISRGRYEILNKKTSGNRSNFDVLHVTGLPTSVWTNNYRDLIVEKSKKTAGERGELADIVKDVESRSDKIVDIYISLYDGWQDRVATTVNRSRLSFEHELDNIEILFRLYLKLEDEINILGEDGTVVSYVNHKDMINDWFKLRLKYYRMRISRLKAITQIKIINCENRLRYLQEFDSLNLCRKSPDEFEKILADNGYTPYREITFSNICSNQIPTDKLITFATCNISDEDKILFGKLVGSNAIREKMNYSYLRKLPTGSVTDKNIEKVRVELEGLRTELQNLNAEDVEKRIWLSELSELKKVVSKLYE